MPLFSKSDPFSRPFGQTWTTPDPNWRPAGPLAGPAELQNGCKSHSWGQALTNLSTQSSAVDLHAQLNPRICCTWPNSWQRFGANRMACLWSGRGTVKPHWSNCSDAFLAIQNWTGQLGIASRICKGAFDWHTKGSAGDGRRQTSAWRPDVNCLAIQT